MWKPSICVKFILLEVEAGADIEYACVALIFVALYLLACVAVEQAKVVTHLYINSLSDGDARAKAYLKVEAAVVALLVVVGLYGSIASCCLEG